MVHYNADDLKAIGHMCSNRLPPASSVQAMFLYEMQRETELERLFQGQMFELARAKDTSRAQQSKVAELEEQMKSVTKQLRARELDDRLASSKVRIDSQNAKINEQSVRINKQGELLENLRDQTEALATGAETTNRHLADNSKSLKACAHSFSKLSVITDQLKAADFHRGKQFSQAEDKIKQLAANDQNAVAVFQYQGANIQSAFQNTENVKSSLAASDTQNLKNLLVAHSTLTAHLNKLDSSQARLNEDLTDLEDDFKAVKANVSTVAKELSTLQTSTDGLKSTVEGLNEDISILFDERDMLINHLNTASARIDKLEGTVRALTGQMTPTTAPTNNGNGSNSPQMLPVKDAVSGKSFDLAVPKGTPLIEYRKASDAKESLKSIRSFTPGKQWGGNERKENAMPIKTFTPGKQWEGNVDLGRDGGKLLT